MMLAAAERMLPLPCDLVQFTTACCCPRQTPRRHPCIGGPIFHRRKVMGALSQRIVAKVSGPAWEQIRGQFMQISRLLLAASPDADSELVSAYVKFTINSDPQTRIFAAIWLKSSKRLIVGLALPEEYEAEELGPPLPGTMYKGLTKYFVVERGGAVPKGLAEWAGLAYETALCTEPVAGFRLAANDKVLRRAG
jgi:hypothetical protein